MHGFGSRKSFIAANGPVRKMRCAGAVLLAGMLLFFYGCGSDVGFRRFEIQGAPPEKVFPAAVQTVREFYTRFHGGVLMDVDEAKRSLVMGPLEGKPGGPDTVEAPRTATYYTEPVRETLYLQVLPWERGSLIEMMAVIERLSVEDPDRVKTPDDVWRFFRQDVEVEDRLFDEIAKRLAEEGVIR